MKVIHTLLSGFALLLALLAPVSAQDGIDFGSMPVGCKWHLSYSSGWKPISEYIGRERGFHIVETHTPGDPNAGTFRSEFNNDGLLVNRIDSDGSWERFEPHACSSTLATCVEGYTASDGTDIQISHSTRKVGARYLVQSTVVGGAPYDNEKFLLGPFNVKVDIRSIGYRLQVVRFEDCGEISS
jgi:hypothetical protein